MRVDVEGISIGTCNDLFKKLKVNLTSKQLCAGGEAGKDSCQGNIYCSLDTEVIVIVSSNCIYDIDFI